jgi:hypothetical protein
MIQLSLTLHSLTKIQINVAKPQGRRHSCDYFIPWHIDLGGVESRRFDDFGHLIRLIISNHSDELSHQSLPTIEVEARFPHQYETVWRRMASFRRKQWNCKRVSFTIHFQYLSVSGTLEITPYHGHLHIMCIDSLEYHMIVLYYYPSWIHTTFISAPVWVSEVETSF